MNAALILLSLSLGADPVGADFVLKGATLFDGSGQAGVIGDVAIKGDRIVAVGTFAVAGNPKAIDCTGLFVAPGFIDLHTHSDEPLVHPETRANRNYVKQGVTTVVTGNCGSGPANVAVYFGNLQDGGIGTNVIHLVPHNSVKAQAMGNISRDPTAKESKFHERLGMHFVAPRKAGV